MTDSGKKAIERISADRSPYAMMRIFSDVFEGGNNREIAEKHGLSLFDVRLIRQYPDACVLYAMDIQGQLNQYYGNTTLRQYKRAANG